MADELIEEWRVIEQAPDYAVSSLGRVKRLTFARTWASNRIMSLNTDVYGYQIVSMVISGKPSKRKVHRLVCSAFNGPAPDDKPDVAHWDGQPANNVPANLRWVSAADNMRDKVRHGRTNAGDRHPYRKNPSLIKRGDQSSSRTPERRARMEAIRADLATGMRGNEVARKHGVSAAIVSKIKLGQSWA